MSPTLFTLYKRFINKKVAAGETTYTAAELNRHVGCYENITPWKRANNSPYHITRGYQTLLKQLGCITPVKRGLWSINGNIPEWFGSFHFTGLKGGYDLNNTYADHNCIYWKQLPLVYKINPWQGIVDARIDARRIAREAREYEQVTLRRGKSITAELDGPDSTPYASPKLQSLLNAAKPNDNQQRRDKLNAILDAVKEQNNQARLEDVIDASTGVYEPNNKTEHIDKESKTQYRDVILDPGMISTTVRFRATTSFGQELDCISWVNLFAAKDNTWDGEVSDTEITIVSNPHAEYKDILNVLNVLQGVEATKAFLMNLDKFALSVALKSYPAIPAIFGKPEEPKAPEAVGAKTYTLAEVEKILLAYTEYIVDDLESNIDSALSNVDADEVVELDWDRYSKTMDISLDTSSFSNRISSDVEDNIRHCNNNFDITEVELS